MKEYIKPGIILQKIDDDSLMQLSNAGDDNGNGTTDAKQMNIAEPEESQGYRPYSVWDE